MSGVELMVFVLVGIAWWKIDRAIRRWAEAIIGRIDALEGRLARIEGNTAKDRKDLGTFPRGDSGIWTPNGCLQVKPESGIPISRPNVYPYLGLGPTKASADTDLLLNPRPQLGLSP